MFTSIYLFINFCKLGIPVANISTLSIEKAIGLISDSKNIKELNNNYDSVIFDLKTLDVQQFVDKINTFRVSI